MATSTGGNLSFAQLEAVWIQAGGSKTLAPLMAAIALAESGGNPNATNPTDNNGKQTSWGLWQISLGNHNEPASNWNDPLENAKLALGKWKTQGLWAWGTYTSGAYKRFLPSGYVAPDPTLPSGNAATEAGQGIAGVQATGNPEGSFISALGGVYNDVTGGLLSIPGAITGTFGDIDKAVGGFYDGAKLFFQPSTYVRIGAGIFGTVFIITAIVFLAKEAKTA